MALCCQFVESSSPPRRQRVVVDGATSEWITTASRVPQGSVLGPLQVILFTSEMFESVENRLFAYTDDSTLLAVVRQPSDPLMLPSLTRTRLGCKSGAITGA